MVGFIGLSMIYFSYVRDKVNYLLYIICLLFEERVSFYKYIYL